MSTVTITDAPMSIEELLAVAEGAPVELAPSARATIQASRAVVDKALASGDPIYGPTPPAWVMISVSCWRRSWVSDSRTSLPWPTWYC